MSEPAPARICAYAALREVLERGGRVDPALRAAARGLDGRDRALAMRLVYGTVQRRATLDHVVTRLADRPVERLDAPLLTALRLGSYELLYLRGAPDHAVVADVVELAKRAGRGHGLVNAVLRRAAREGPAMLEALDEVTPESAALAHSHPPWIARLWWEQLGAADARALLAADNEPAELALRANTLLRDAPALLGELQRVAPAARPRLDPVLPEALVLDGPFDVYGSRLWREGALIAQSRGAMLPARVLAPRSGERVLDLCAAPGGKTTQLAALMGGRGEVLAIERDPRRAELLRDVARRMRADSVRVVCADATRALGEGEFDRILLDPPCSGLGTLQARADLRWRMTPARAEELARVQRKILLTAAEALRPGGVLVYSTCTISPIENERQIAAFLESNPAFVLDESGYPPGIGTPSMDGGALLTLPHRDRTAGFFIARLRRR